MGALFAGVRLARRDEGAWPKRPVTEEQRRQAHASKQPFGLPDLWRCCRVARRSKIHKGYSPSSRLAAAPNLGQRARSSFCYKL